MQRFQALYDRLDQLNGTKAKVEALVDHLRTSEAGDAAADDGDVCLGVSDGEEAGDQK